MNDFPLDSIRQDFPILFQTVFGKPLVYFDNGATTQKPRQVIDAVSTYYATINSNVHRGVHHLSQLATDAHEAARERVRQFINATHAHEIIFTRGTTESINLIAHTFCKKYVREGDEILLTQMEHHSNIVPWQLACEDRGATIKYIPISANGELVLDDLDAMMSDNTKLLACTWVSNTLGTINPVEKLIEKAKQKGIPVLLDAAQAVQHIEVDVQELDVDFLAFSGHKIYAPTGIGILYGKEKWLLDLPPYQGGGSMIKTVSAQSSTYADLPFKFEAGTPDVGGIVGLDAALQYVQQLGIANIAAYEHHLFLYAKAALQEIEGIRFIGEAQQQTATISFLVKELHPFDVGELLDKQGIAVRTGHHCCQPIMDAYSIPGTVRASFSFYNTKEEVDHFVKALQKAIMLLS